MVVSDKHAKPKRSNTNGFFDWFDPTQARQIQYQCSHNLSLINIDCYAIWHD